MLIDYIRNLSLELEIEHELFKTADPNIYQLETEEDLTIQMAQEGEGVYLLCQLCETPDSNQEQIYFESMCATLFGQATYGNIIGMSDDSKYLTLSRHIEYDSSYQEFRSTLEDFVNAATYWKSHILSLSQ